MNKNPKHAIYISDTPVTFKQSQGHQLQNDNVDPKQGYNRPQFERSCFNGVQEKDHIFFPLSNKKIY